MTTVPNAAPPAMLLSARDLARLLSVSTATVWRMRSADKLPAPLRLTGGILRWRRQTIDEWLRDLDPTNGNGQARR